MTYTKIDLTKDAYLEAYVADKLRGFTRDAILVIPGGGYSAVCADREGEPIAIAFLPHGYNAFVLHYSVGKKPFPEQLIEASLAIKHIKDNAEEYGINPDRVFVVGFSAGGHLAASLGTMWDKKEITDKVDMPYGYNKPTGMMLIYPVISAKYHKLSFDNLFLGKEVTQEILNACSIENNVSKNTPPAYIIHSSNDTVVDVKNVLVLADALSKNNIQFEMHIYPDAFHGAALANEITKCGEEGWARCDMEEWVDNAVRWAKKL